MTSCTSCSGASRLTGKLEIAEYPGDINPFRNLGNATVSYGAETETENVMDMTNPAGGVCATAMKTGVINFNAELSDAACPDNAALGMLGVKTTYTAGVVVTAEAQMSFHGYRFFLSRMPDPAVAVIVEDITDTITYVLGTDYTVDAEGYITTLSTGTITDGQVLHVTYTTLGSISIDALKSVFKDYTVKFTGINDFNTKQVEVIWYKVKLAAAATKAVNTGEHVVLALNGVVQNDPLHDGTPWKEEYQV